MNRKNWITTLAAIIVSGASAASVMAQPAPGGGFQPGQGQGRGAQGGGFDPTQIRQTLSDRMKEALGASDDEWKVIGPKVEKVQALQQDTASGAGGMMSMMRRLQGGGGGGRANQPNIGAIFGGNANSDVQLKTADLDKALDNPATTENEIRIKLTAVREAREKAKVALAQSRKELIELLTQRQEAVLFQMGILE